MKRWMMLALIAACGREQHVATDAGPEVSADSLVPSTGEVPADAVSIRVTRNGAAVAGVAALFQSSTSELIESKLTNQDGVAWARMIEGGFVTAIDNSSGTEELTTFASVTLGDQLHLDLQPVGARDLRPVKLEFPPDTSGATSYLVQTSCSSEPYGFAVAAPQPPALPNEMLLSGCTDGTADILISSLLEGEPTGRVLYAPSVVLPAAVPPQHYDADPLPPSPLLTVTGTFVALEQHVIQITNVPPSVASVGVHQSISALHRVYGQSGFGIPNASGVRIELQMPPASSSMLTATTTNPASGDYGFQRILDWAQPTVTYALDLAGAMLPAVTMLPAFDATTRQLTWTERAATTQPDAVRAGLTIYRDDIPEGRAWRWRITAPRTGTTVTFPQLPVLGFDFNPAATDAISVNELTTAKLPGGYAAVRENAFGNINAAVAGPSGRIVVRDLYIAEPL